LCRPNRVADNLESEPNRFAASYQHILCETINLETQVIFATKLKDSELTTFIMLKTTRDSVAINLAHRGK